jgi:hypothetical protein
MDATSITDNTTVVAGPSSAVNRKDLSHHQYDFVKPEHAPSSSTQAPYPKAQNEFGRTADLTMADRQFFVTIGHDGLIGALQKLDRELQNVSVSQNLRSSKLKRSQSGRNKILSKKVRIAFSCWPRYPTLYPPPDSYRLDWKGSRSRKIRYHQPRRPSQGFNAARSLSGISTA